MEITIIGAFAIGFLLACYFAGQDNKQFIDFCIMVNKWMNKKNEKTSTSRKD